LILGLRHAEEDWSLSRHFPPPWTVDELADCFIVRDDNGQALGYFYFDGEPHRLSLLKTQTRQYR
jgi:hypothetical protein